MKKITFQINNTAYTIDLGEDPNKKLENGLKKFLSIDKNLNTEALLLAYLKKTEELVEYENKLQYIIDTSILY
jgi:hypothetical protein